MSGSTRVERRSERVRLVLETPCISFATNPDGSSPEQDYHARARERFEAQIALLWPGLDTEIERAAADLGLELLALDEPEGWQRRVWLPYEAGHIELLVKTPLDDAQRERLRACADAIGEARRPPPEPEPTPEPSPAPTRWWWPF